MSGYRDPDPPGTFYGNRAAAVEHLAALGIPPGRAQTLAALAAAGGRAVSRRVVVQYRRGLPSHRRYRITPDGAVTLPWPLPAEQDRR